jgi:hypothetical protein
VILLNAILLLFLAPLLLVVVGLIWLSLGHEVLACLLGR